MPVTIGRRELIAALGGAATWSLAAQSQQPGRAFSASAFSAPTLLLPARLSRVSIHR
jgi:hypothetical protein